MTVVFLGDYVDRGPDSRGVIEFLLNEPIPGERTRICLKGNHEALMIAYLAGRDDGQAWCANGALATLASYGIELGPSPSARDIAGARGRLLEAMPAGHKAFLDNLALIYEADDYLFVHAGVRPGVPLERQVERDLIWIRGEFYASARPIDRYVVHGHTPVEQPLILPQRADIDTGAWMTDRLTCLVLEDSNKRFIL